ncbi:FAD-binding oxidoreductase [Chlorobium phaeovibrioides]|uniref:FAD-binding oxidoreductase n=1 Tax=Chlorobium phaeovibrioides TaxID=1094 RepID=UPI000F8439F8|nr:FAD-binding oxidoreductase [Chlorobium phaeovibrioides]RTY37172.1 FAD-binding oxidoreductase [Chlorobium phaeovibrioides]
MISKTDQESIRGFLEDTSNLKSGHTPGVFFPETIAEIGLLLKNAPAENRRFTIAGNGTGTTGGRIPFGDFVLAMEKLDAIGEPVVLSPDKAIITVQGGAILQEIQKKVQAAGWLYPPDPTEALCFIGGTIANNSSGARTLKYGPTRNHIARLLVVLPEGELLEIRRGEQIANSNGDIHLTLPGGSRKTIHLPHYTMPATSKHNAGYFSTEGMDLIDLFIGSEGTLGVIAEADLMLIPLPQSIISCLIYFQSMEELLGFINTCKNNQTDSTPRALEFFDRNALTFLREQYPEVPTTADGAVFLELETTEEKMDEALDRLFEAIEASNGMAEESWMALDRSEQEKIREFRHALPLIVNEWLSRQKESKISTDMAVPDHAFRELFDFYRSSCEQHGFVYIIFGHIGNAHVHLNILPRNREEFVEAKALYRTFVKKAIALGGTLSAEHGIGKLKSEYLAELYGEDAIREMAAIKKCLDPFLVLNIGNIIPLSFLEPDNH